MNSRAPLLGAVAVLSFFAGATGIRLAYTLAYALILTLAVACGWSWLVVRRVVITRTSPEGTVMVGEPFVESFTVHNQGVLPVAYCEVYDLSTVGGYYPGRACALRGGDTVGWTARGVFARRGHHNFGPLEARLGDPFGLFPRTIRVAPVRSVTVYPRIHHIEDLGAVWSGGSNGDIGHGRIVDAPPDVATVREYLPEDGFGRIHWRSTARTGRLMSRSFDTRNSADVLIVLDLQAGTHAGVDPNHHWSTRSHSPDQSATPHSVAARPWGWSPMTRPQPPSAPDVARPTGCAYSTTWQPRPPTVCNRSAKPFDGIAAAGAVAAAWS